MRRAARSQESTQTATATAAVTTAATTTTTTTTVKPRKLEHGFRRIGARIPYTLAEGHEDIDVPLSGFYYTTTATTTASTTTIPMFMLRRLTLTTL